MRETLTVLWSPISLASLWASSTGWTLDLKALPNRPSTVFSMRFSIDLRTFTRLLREVRHGAVGFLRTISPQPRERQPWPGATGPSFQLVVGALRRRHRRRPASRARSAGDDRHERDQRAATATSRTSPPGGADRSQTRIGHDPVRRRTAPRSAGPDPQPALERRRTARATRSQGQQGEEAPPAGRAARRRATRRSEPTRRHARGAQVGRRPRASGGLIDGEGRPGRRLDAQPRSRSTAPAQAATRDRVGGRTRAPPSPAPGAQVQAAAAPRQRPPEESQRPAAGETGRPPRRRPGTPVRPRDETLNTGKASMPSRTARPARGSRNQTSADGTASGRRQFLRDRRAASWSPR